MCALFAKGGDCAFALVETIAADTNRARKSFQIICASD
jgi:hypothetical protein